MSERERKERERERGGGAVGGRERERERINMFLRGGWIFFFILARVQWIVKC